MEFDSKFIDLLDNIMGIDDYILVFFKLLDLESNAME